jgi:hypothetical protein
MKIITRALLMITLLAAGCAPQAASSPTITSTAAQPTQVVSVPPTATPEPSPTPQPGKVILSAPVGTDPKVAQAVVAELSSAAGLTLETLNDLQPAGISSEVRIIVLLAAPGNLNDLLNAAPQAQFIVISGSDIPAAANLTVIRWKPENQAFLGGFISVLLSSDWRAGGLIPSDGPLGAGLQQAFENGGHYFCGPCGPGWPLGVYYPQTAPLPAASDGPAWQAAAAGLFDTQKAEVYYLSSEAYKQEIFDYLQGRSQNGKTLLLVGSQTPPDSLHDQWAATVGFDTLASLRQAWPGVLAGKGGAVIEAPLTLSDVNAANLGEGRQRLVNELMIELQAGKIYPFTLPLQ